MKQFNAITLTHRSLGLDLVGRFHVEPELQREKFEGAQEAFKLSEFMFISTCNRVEFFFRTPSEVDEAFVHRFLRSHYADISEPMLEQAVSNSRMYKGIDAIRHLFAVTSSLDSLVVGEREIITQVRQAFERASKSQHTGDFLRLAVQKAIETAKQVYTETEIATKPVSIVNLAYRKLLERDIHSEQHLLIIGAGTTIEALTGNLKLHGFKSVKVFNRTLSKAEKIAKAMNGKAFTLDQLKSEAGEHDIIISCTGAEGAIVDLETYKGMQNGVEGSPKIIIDLAIPNDIDAAVADLSCIDYISIEELKGEAKRNLKDREKEVFRCEALVEERLREFEDAFRTRKLELAMRHVPETMKEIKTRALDQTFARDIEKMDGESRATLERIVDYLEKKYISVPMKMARQVVLDQDLKDPIID